MMERRRALFWGYFRRALEDHRDGKHLRNIPTCTSTDNEKSPASHRLDAGVPQQDAGEA